MATSKKCANYCEPWTATKSVTHGSRPEVTGLPEEAAEKILDAWDRSDQKADWIVWGTGMVDPGHATGLVSGKPVAFDDRLIVVVVRNPAKQEGREAPKAELLASRIAACVSSCRGIADPATTLAGVRDLLRDLCNGASDADDPRVVGLLARMLPAGQEIQTREDL